MHQNGKETIDEERNHLKSFHREKSRQNCMLLFELYFSLFHLVGTNGDEEKQTSLMFQTLVEAEIGKWSSVLRQELQ
jgi:hypothetical protein